MYRYEHTNLPDEKIAELVRESLAAVGLKVCVMILVLKLKNGGSARDFFEVQLAVLRTICRPLLLCGAHFRSLTGC